MSKVKLWSPGRTLSGSLTKANKLTFLKQQHTQRIYTRMVNPQDYVRHTPAQQIARTQFAQLRREAQQLLEDPALREQFTYQWAHQKRPRKFHSLLGFVMHTLSQNN